MSGWFKTAKSGKLKQLVGNLHVAGSLNYAIPGLPLFTAAICKDPARSSRFQKLHGSFSAPSSAPGTA